MSLKDLAQETLKIVEEGKFINSSGQAIDFSQEQRAAEAGTKLYVGDRLSELLQQLALDETEPLTIEVTDETTQVAAQRLVELEGCSNLVLLNYASAYEPGGGFLNGAKAQEEDLARCSGLYPCLLKQPTYYQVNRSFSSPLYSDRIIYSPQVPWFRTHSHELLEDFFLASVITAPAPNAGKVLRSDPQARSEIEEVLRRRAGYVLAVARDNGHRSLLLGAWGCGVFQNDANMVADAFGQWLDELRFQGYFDRVVFAVYDSSQERKTLKAFQNRFQ